MALADADAAKAYQAMNKLSESPQPAVRTIKDHLPPITAPPEPRHIAKLLADLDNSKFQVREQAARELAKLGESVQTDLHHAASTSGSLEFRSEKITLA